MKKIFCLLMSLSCLLSACSDDDKENTESVKSPKFLFSTPANQSSDILLDSEVSVVYNTPIVVDDNNSIKVNGANAVVTVNDRKLVFNISLEKNETYEIVIPEGAVKNTVGEPASEVILSFSTVSDTKRIEAENANLSGGAVVENSLSGFSGTGYVNQKDGDITFKVVMPEAGMYKVDFRYSNGNSHKENDLVVNGIQLSTISFDATDEWKTLGVNKINLKSGENIITVKKNWGWINLDYIEISPASDGIPFDIAANLVTPLPSAEAIKVYTFLKDNFGKKIISGAMANYSTGLEEASWMYEQTGKWPALTGFDYINYTRDWSTINSTELTNNAKAWWNENGLVTIMWHWRDPSKTTDGFYTKDTSFDISKINDVNSVEYKAMIADIDVIATYLKQLKDAKVPVIWRPLHEASGGWFWWGAKGAEPCKTLWKIMFDRLVNYHQLNNLIWVWTSDAAGSTTEWYPGNEYVDIIGMDIYPGENQHGSQYIAFDKVKELFDGTKIITLSECGSIPNIDAMFEYGDTWSWFMPWNGDYTRSDKHNGASFFTDLFSNDRVITRDQMPNFK